MADVSELPEKPQPPAPPPLASSPAECLLTLLIVVPRGADPTSWVRARSAIPGGRCRIILAHADSTEAGARDAFVETVNSSHGPSIFHLWAAAMRQASSPYFAVLDARCPPGEAWFLAAMRAIDAEIPAYFGPVTFPADGDARAIVEYLLEYGQFARPVDAGLDEVPGNNLVFRSDLLESSDTREDQFHKVFFVDRLKREGRAPVYRDDLEVLYAKRYRTIHYLRRRFAHGRTFAAMRSSGRGSGYRLYRALSSPVLPLLRLFRILRSLRGKRELQAALLCHPAYAFAAESAWSAGECAGYLTGKPGDLAFLD